MNETTLGITGASGMLGTAVKRAALARGYRVISFRHREGPTSQDERVFNLQSTSAPLEGIDVLLHLAGKNLFTPWTPQAKKEFWTSRVDLSAHLATRLRECDSPPKQVISASGISFYGARAQEELIETSSSGSGFLADLTVAWEQALQTPDPAPWRLHHLRTSMILGPESAAVTLLRNVYRWHLGQRLGPPQSWLSWMHLEDYVNLVFHLIETPSPSGPVNASAPESVTQAEFHQALQDRWGRAWLPQVPNTQLLQSVLGDASDLLLSSLRVVPKKLLDEGFMFQYPRLSQALASLPD